MFHFVRRITAIAMGSAAVAVVAAVAAPASASAALVNLDNCDGSVLTRPFTPWADFASYKLAPGGDFESGLAGWSLSGGAGVSGGSEPYAVTGALGASSLGLPSGSVATSPQTCVDAAYPTFRFLSRTDDPGTAVNVSVIYNGPLGAVTIPVGAVLPGPSWQLTPLLVTGSALGGALNGGTADMELRFTASGGSAQVDDVYIDPTGRCC